MTAPPIANQIRRLRFDHGEMTQEALAQACSVTRQTIIALERKGYIAKSARPGGRKSLSLALTPAGQEMLRRDPWGDVAAAAEELGGKTRRRLHRGLSELLDGELGRAGLASFGLCSSCRFFRQKGRSNEPGGPHLCMLFEQPLTEDDAVRICKAHEPAG